MDRPLLNLYDSNMRCLAGQTSIENYNLFGEQAELPDIVHCETIEIRSRLHNWEFVAHRHGRLHQMLLLEDGRGRVTLDGPHHELSSAQLVNVPAGCVHGFSFQPGTTGWVVTLSVDTLDDLLVETEGLRPLLMRPHVIRRTQAHRGLVEQLFDEHSRQDFARAQLLRGLTVQLLGLVARAIASLQVVRQTPAAEPLFRRFERLVGDHFTEHLGVADYAQLLAVSPTHLSRVSRRATGLSASAIILERMIREARRHLVFTNLSIAEIGYLLGFSDPAYFTRVFTKATGMPPSSFRAKLDH